MSTKLHPGVYVSEVPSGIRSIEGASTSTTIFVGETERGPLGPTLIKSRSDYERYFGGYFREHEPSSPPTEPSRVLTTYAIDGFFQNGGSSAYILRALDSGTGTAPTVAERDDVVASSPGLWGNSVEIAYLPSSGGSGPRFRIDVAYRFPRTGERSVVESFDRLSTDPNDENYVVDVLGRSSYVRWRADTVPTVPSPDWSASPPERPDNAAILAATQPLTGGSGGGGDITPANYTELLAEGLEGIDDAALLVASCSGLLTDTDYTDHVQAFIDFAEARPRNDLFYVGDLPRQNAAGSPTAATAATVAAKDTLSLSNFSGLFWPHIEIGDPVGVGRNPTITVPPAGAIAGLFARTDGRRGVWKAPAGTEATVLGSSAIEYRLNDLHSDELNPEGINALRQIPGAGRVVWGSRTLRPDGEWRYIPVRRTAIFLRTSIFNGIQWAVFEPNDEPLWASLRATIGGFMETQFRNGAFAGATSDQAYFVKVDSETTTEIDQAAGLVNIRVGFAPLRPAEFVAVELSQKTQESN